MTIHIRKERYCHIDLILSISPEFYFSSTYMYMYSTLCNQDCNCHITTAGIGRYMYMIMYVCVYNVCMYECVHTCTCVCTQRSTMYILLCTIVCMRK